MSRSSDINVCSVSFLDLLSGALAAVIIRFVGVSRMDAESRQTLDLIEDHDWHTAKLPAMEQADIQQVSQSLYVAFDTILLSLFLRIILMFQFQVVQEAVETLHTRMESYVI